MTTPSLLATVASLLTTAWLASLWQGALLVLSGALLLRLMPNASATLRHTLLLVFFLLTAALPWVPIHHAAATAGSPAVHLSLTIAFALAACWIAATLYRLASLAVAWHHLRSVRRKATPLAFDLDILPLNRRPIVCTSPDIDSPLIVGFFRPVMLLPDWLAPSLTPAELHHIAVHECEHLRRRDDWTNLALQLGLTLFPLNPALLWLNQRIAVQRELACDAAVAAVARPVDYAASLAKIAEHRLHRNKLRFALAALGRQSELAHRVHVLLQEPKKWSALQKATTAAAAALVLAASATAITHTPQFVSVDTPTPIALATSTAPEPTFRGTTPTAHFIATSYIAPAATPTRHLAKHKPALAPRTQQQPDFLTISTTTPPQRSPFRMTSASVDPAPTTTASATPAPDQPTTPIELFTPVYSRAYLAVPVNNGWLIIQI